MIVCYAPKIYADDTLKDGFYDNPQSVIDSIPLHDLTCIAVDLKAKVGQDRSYRLGVMDQHGLGTITKNGARLFSFTKGNDLLISGELFQHKDINTYTWTSRNGTVKNQIDHFLIHQIWRTSLRGVRSFQSADVGSDHKLVVTILKLNLKSNTQKLNTDILRSFDVNKLSDKGVRYSFGIKLSNIFESLYDLPEDVKEDWETIGKNYTDAAKDSHGFGKPAKQH